MTPWLVLVSGWIESLFGISVMLAPSMVVAGIGGSDLDGPVMVMVCVLGVAMFAISVRALLGRTWSAVTDGQSTAYAPWVLCGHFARTIQRRRRASAGPWRRRVRWRRALGRRHSTLGCCNLLHLRLRNAPLKRYAPAKAT